MPGMLIAEEDTPAMDPYFVNKTPQSVLTICGASDAQRPLHSSPSGYVTENGPLLEVMLPAVATRTGMGFCNRRGPSAGNILIVVEQALNRASTGNKKSSFNRIVIRLTSNSR